MTEQPASFEALEPEDTPVPVGSDPGDSGVDAGPQDDYEEDTDGVPEP